MTSHEVDALEPGDRLNFEAAGRMFAGNVALVMDNYIRVEWRDINRGDVILKHSPLWLAIRVCK